jgi:hypothetical protein
MVIDNKKQNIEKETMITFQVFHAEAWQRKAFLLILLCVILASVLLPVHLNVPLMPCLFQSIFHIPCPGCGMTRAFILLGHFRIQEAFMMNCNSIFIYGLIVFITMNELIGWLTGWQVRFRPSRKLVIFIFIISLGITVLGWYHNLAVQKLI